ncbi:MAG: hydrogenase maturation nickel metallochaperone HypA [Treponema sp.]|nr:hydrogenase maturation nickel metallochaperone HypA [Treponema sp.]
MKKISGFIPPKPNQEQHLICAQCGTSFMGKLIPFFTKCPQCGSIQVKADFRVRY